MRTFGKYKGSEEIKWKLTVTKFGLKRQKREKKMNK